MVGRACVGSSHLFKHEATACGNNACVVLSVTSCHLILANRECLNQFFSRMLIKMSRHAFTPHRTGFCGNSISLEGSGYVNFWYINNIVFTTGTFTWGLNWENCDSNTRIKITRFLRFSCLRKTQTNNFRVFWVRPLTIRIAQGPVWKSFRLFTCCIGDYNA